MERTYDELRSLAGSLYDGGWRHTDKEQLMQEYGFDDWEAQKQMEVWAAEEKKPIGKYNPDWCVYIVSVSSWGSTKFVEGECGEGCTNPYTINMKIHRLPLKYSQDGNHWKWWHTDNPETYWETDEEGCGIFLVDLARNERSQIKGTCDFSVSGLTLRGAKRKIRQWMNK